MQEEGGDVEEEGRRGLSPPSLNHTLKSFPHHVRVCVSHSKNQTMFLPLNTVREPRAVVGGGGVVAAHGIQEVVARCHPHASSSLGHGSTHAPLVGVRIEALHRPQT